jgi:UDP-GlcNAc3NAcA epimerase
MKLIAVIGTRPQYIKHSAFVKEVNKHADIELITIDTGQHYDNNMSEIFIDGLNINYNLKIRSALHGEQTALMLVKIEEILIKENPAAVIVYGDTNSTLAGSLAASKLKLKIVHIEAGMRNHDITVPEEINRVITDRISTLRIAPSAVALANLIDEGLAQNSYLLGDITTDLIMHWPNEKLTPSICHYYFATIHRPYNTEDKSRLNSILTTLNELDNKVIMPLHPRTKNMTLKWQIDLEKYQNIDFIEPTSFSESINHIIQCAAVITDSGGVQKEAYILKKKCITILPSTPWEETLVGKWNQLVFNNLNDIFTLLKIEPDEKLYIGNKFGNGKVALDVIEKIRELTKG